MHKARDGLSVAGFFCWLRLRNATIERFSLRQLSFSAELGGGFEDLPDVERLRRNHHVRISVLGFAGSHAC